MAIYTKTGDKGETKVFDKKSGELTQVRKDSCHIKTIGAIDELNSYLGVVKSKWESKQSLPGKPGKSESGNNYYKKLEQIQGNLFTINSILAGSKLGLSSDETKNLEKQIDDWEGTLPVQMNFIYYGGSEISSLLFYARALARRAERELVEFTKEQEVPEDIQKYINRLSDYLFMMARSVNIKSGVKESYWITKK